MDIELREKPLLTEDLGEEFELTTSQPKDFQGNHVLAFHNLLYRRSRWTSSIVGSIIAGFNYIY